MKVKRFYFEKDGQVQQLQNTVAHQRMSTSRTVLDDNEYAVRFNRLDGAINNLAFNIRKDWKSIPPWLQGVVNEEAHAIGSKEMTAVGRACLTRWLVDEIYDRYFHPGIEPNLSRQLKIIEKNIRRQGNVASDEDKENHVAKLSAWRRTTLEGLSDVLQSRTAEDNRTHLTDVLVEKLTASLEMNLKSPPPPGLENGVAMIIELAINISANMPLESREIAVDYFLPGTPITENYMKIETALPPLTNPGVDPPFISEVQSIVDRTEQGSTKGQDLGGECSAADYEKDSTRDSSSSSHSGYGNNQTYQNPRESRKKSVFGFMGKRQSQPPSQPQQSQQQQQQQQQQSQSQSQSDAGGGRTSSASQRDGKERGEEPDPTTRELENRIRFSAFVSVEVRGKSNVVVVKAPVYPFSYGG